MATTKFLSLVLGRITEIVPEVISQGISSAGKLLALGADGRLDASVMPIGIGQNTQTATAVDSIPAGSVVSLFNNSNTTFMRRADGTSVGKEAHAFVKEAVAQNALGTAYLPGNVLTGLTSLTPGLRYYLSTTPGTVQATPLSATGNVHQLIGVASNTTSLIFEPEEPITLA